MLEFDTLTIAAHVTLGVLAVTLGAIALAARKGATIHVRAGRLFVFSMGLSSLFGAALGMARFETLFIAFHAGILGATLVASGVLAARIRQRGSKFCFTIVAGVNVLNGIGLISAGLYAFMLPDAVLFGFQAADYLFLFAMALVAFISDVCLVFRKHITEKHRIAQHLWRMCLGFFIAAGSAFTGPGASAFPEAIQNSGILSLPELTIITLMFFWLFKTLLRRRPERNALE